MKQKFPKNLQRPLLEPKADENAEASIPCHLRDRGDCDCANDRCLLRDVSGRPLLYPD